MLRLVLTAPPGSVYVSLYESGSTDLTPAWVALLDVLLPALGVPAHVVWGGGVRKAKGEYRIAYLARVGLLSAWGSTQKHTADGYQCWLIW
jgi:alpha-1,3-mannosyltransferase